MTDDELGGTLDAADRASAAVLHAKALELEEAGQPVEAAEAYRQALEIDPGSGSTWFNLGLLCKRLKRWPEALEANRRAHAIDPGDAATSWNLGIAATATGAWADARAAWRSFGVAVDAGDGPPTVDLGRLPLRLDPERDAEVVWAQRLDPARARIENVPAPRTGFARGDVVLHDGEPTGWRTVGGEDIPIFDVLEVLERSGDSTWEAEMEAPSAADMATLVAACAARDIGLDDWTPESATWVTTRRLGLSASASAPLKATLEDWAGRPGRALRSLERVLER